MTSRRERNHPFYKGERRNMPYVGIMLLCFRTPKGTHLCIGDPRRLKADRVPIGEKEGAGIPQDTNPCDLVGPSSYFLFSLLAFLWNSKCLFSVQFNSVAQSCPTLCDSVNCSTPGLPVHHQLPEFTQTHVHRVGDAIQPSHPLSSPSPPAPNPSQHQGLFQ